jgi:molybdate transport system substrate-binding protein
MAVPRTTRRRLAHWLAGAAVALEAGPVALHAQEVATLAAADLKFALEELAARFERARGHRLRLVFGSSSHLKTQILHGAPFHLFLSADATFVLEPADAGLTESRGRLYARGRIGIFVPHGSPLQLDGRLADLAAALNDGRLRRFAIANPDHEPYGQRAREALQRAGLWDAIRPRLVFGENVSQAAQFATSGSTQGGIIALALALAPGVARLGHFDSVPEDWHAPLQQRMVLIAKPPAKAPPAARAFHDALTTPRRAGDAGALWVRGAARLTPTGV